MKALGRLEPVQLRDYWLHEAQDFTPWLASSENLELLSTTLEMELELDGIEVPVGPYKADIVARDVSSDSRVVIENQLEGTDHDHLGKAITYASGLDASVIIWIAKSVTEEHRRAIDFLNEKAAPALRCYLIEMQLWRIGDSAPAPLFKVLAMPNDYIATIKLQEDELSETQRLYLNFWEGFKEFCMASGTTLKLPLPKPYPQNWYPISVGRTGFSLNLSATVQKKRIGCEIYLSGSAAKQAFNALEQHRIDIDQKLGPLEWQNLPKNKDAKILRYRDGIDMSQPEAWDTAFAWLKHEAERFYQVFPPIIKSLPVLGSYNDQLEDGEADEE